MNKKTLIIIIAVVLIVTMGIGVYFYWSKKSKPAGLENLEKISDTADKIKDSAAKGVLPSIQTNPLEDKPDLNPLDKTNPYKNIKTNPFE